MIGDASGKEGQFSDSDKKTAENFGIDYMDVEDFVKEMTWEDDPVELKESCDLSDLSKALKGAGDFVDGYIKKVKEQAKEKERERKKDK